MIPKEKLTPIFNTMFNDKLNADPDTVSHLLQEYLEDRVQQYDLKVTDASVEKVADKITISFKIGDGQVQQTCTSVWQEQELLGHDKLITTLMSEELKSAAEDFRAAIAQLGRPQS